MATPNEKFKFKDAAQCRMMPIIQRSEETEKRIDCERYVEGYATTYGDYLLCDWGDEGKVYERFEPGCFDGCDMGDVILQFDHEGRVFARTTNGTLIVEPDERGLFTAANLDTTEMGHALYEDVVARMLTKMSWRFRVGTYHVERTEGNRDVTIVHTKIPKIYDVSIVSIPANENTEINARDFVHGVMDEITRSEAELDDKRARLRIKAKSQL